MPDKRHFHEFLAEAEDIVHSLSINLSQMKSNAVSSRETNPDIVNDLFRGIHTLKGIAATFGFTRLTRLSHKLEDILDNLRVSSNKFSIQLIDTFLDGIEVLIRLLSDINEKGLEDFDITPILAKIDQTAKDLRECEITAVPAEEYISPDLLSGLNDYEIQLLKAKI
ncbi:MAG: Hpt domain-containing protein, partial [Nitrospira sp.]|nr:Hpt domain-containing protein [Nitrospira sp.]